MNPELRSAKDYSGVSPLNEAAMRLLRQSHHNCEIELAEQAEQMRREYIAARRLLAGQICGCERPECEKVTAAIEAILNPEAVRTEARLQGEAVARELNARNREGDSHG